MTIQPEDLRADARFVDIPPAMLRRWSIDDQWETRRNDLFTTLANRLEREIETKLSGARAENLDRLQRLAAQAEAKMQDAPVKSWEGATRALVDITRFMEETRLVSKKEAVHVVQPAQTGQIDLRGDMTPEELEAATKAYLQVRRERMKKIDEQYREEQRKHLEVVKK